MQEKIKVTYDEFVNTPYEGIEKRVIAQHLTTEFRNLNPGKNEQEFSAEWDKVRRDPVKWNELVKKALKLLMTNTKSKSIKSGLSEDLFGSTLTHQKSQHTQKDKLS